MTSINNINDIFCILQDLLSERERVIVLIAGNSRSGKTTLSNSLATYLVNGQIPVQKIELDDWIISFKERTKQMNVYDRFNSKKIETDFHKLFLGEKITISAYDAASRGENRISKVYKLIDQGVIIIEGVVAVGLNILYKNANISIYVTVDEKIRKKRFFEFYNQKGLSNNEVEDLYKTRYLDEFTIVDMTKNNASIIYELNN